MAEALIVRRGGSGGASLNFKVVGGTSVPSNPSANTIWVNTSTAISDWVFSATQPTGATGRVWIQTDKASTVAFNALKKNNIMVYPVSVKQYVSSKWVDKTAKTWNGSKWIDWYNGEIFLNGNQYTDITGGWKACNGSGQKVTIGSSSMVFTNTGDSDRYATAYTVNSLDLSKYTKIIATISIPSTSDAKDEFKLGVTNQNTNNEPTSFVASKTITAQSGNMDVTLDISTVTRGYVALYASRYATVTVTKIRLA